VAVERSALQLRAEQDERPRQPEQGEPEAAELATDAVEEEQRGEQ
jgi:hypothetical protein